MVWGESVVCLFSTAVYGSPFKRGDNGRSLGNQGGWNLRFIRPFNDWEMEETRRLIDLISSKKKFYGERDRIFWLVDKKGQYTDRANYSLAGDDEHGLLVDLIWNKCVPPKVSVLTWEVWWGKVLTMNQLKKRGFQLAS